MPAERFKAGIEQRQREDEKKILESSNNTNLQEISVMVHRRDLLLSLLHGASPCTIAHCCGVPVPVPSLSYTVGTTPQKELNTKPCRLTVFTASNYPKIYLTVFTSSNYPKIYQTVKHICSYLFTAISHKQINLSRQRRRKRFKY